MEFTTILFQVLSLFVMMGIGVFARKKGYMSNEAKKGMTDILIKIVTPAVVVSSFSGEFVKSKLENALIVLAGAFIMHIILCLTSLLMYRKREKAKQAVLRFGIIFGNFGFMGFPVLQSLFGIDGIFYGAMFTAAFYLFSWTFGVSLFTKTSGLKDTVKSILNPPFIAVVLSLLMYISPFRLPSFFQSPVDAIGAMNTPLSMLIVGSIFADVKLKDLVKDKVMYISVALRILGAPIFAMLVMVVLNLITGGKFSGMPFEIIVLEEAMPAGAYTAIFASKFGGDDKLASLIVAVSTALSVLTIPLVAWLMGVCGI